MRKLHLLMLLLFVILSFVLTACDKDDDDGGEDPRDSVYVAADADTSIFRDQMPMPVNFAVPNSMFLAIYALDCYADTLGLLFYSQANAGYNTLFLEPSMDDEDGIYCLRMCEVEAYSRSILSEFIFTMTTREFPTEFKQFAISHFDINKYEDYEFQAAMYSDPDNYIDEFTGTRDTWFAMDWQDRMPYLPRHFYLNVRDNQDDRFYSAIADNPEQFGCGWDDAVNNDAYGIDNFNWEGTSEHLDEYLIMYEEFQD